MFVLAPLVAVLPALVVGDFREWLYRGLVVLTVSCSCALVISVPVSVVAAVSRAARDGILIKGGAYLEALGNIRTIAFDKTGTLTRGRPRLVDVVSMNGLRPDDILRLAAALEAASEHPLAEAIVRAAEERDIRWPQAQELRAIPGVGVVASVDGRRLFLGRPEGRVGVRGEAEVRRLEGAGKTVVLLAAGDEPIGLLAVEDELRPEAAPAVAELRELGIRHLVMLTGDNERTAAAVAAQAGIDGWEAGLLPEDKTAAVKALRDRYGAVAMVGDGVNDAPALAAADVGVAMGAAGTDVALETADVALMADDLTRLPLAVRQARRAVRNIRQNVVMSLVTVAILVTAALAGRLSLTSGLLLNEGTALLIIANGLRLLWPVERRTGPSGPPTRGGPRWTGPAMGRDRVGGGI
jgi:Cd2+/Zn2+-exporting ATPase